MEKQSSTTPRKPWTKPTIEVLQARMAACAPAVASAAPGSTNQ